MNQLTLSGYVRKKNKSKITTRGEDSMTFVLEVQDDNHKMKITCVVFNRLVRRVDKAVEVNDKILIHGSLKTFNQKNKDCLMVVEQLELLDFIRFEDKLRGDKCKTKNEIIAEELSRIGR